MENQKEMKIFVKDLKHSILVIEWLKKIEKVAVLRCFWSGLLDRPAVLEEGEPRPTNSAFITYVAAHTTLRCIRQTLFTIMREVRFTKHRMSMDGVVQLRQGTVHSVVPSSRKKPNG
ncbi:hypothetical protein CDAR_292161 [Caerostris darwini]|uniref:Uncharacterized protein n=1 Tax=Caerostris darwini TaxID=1538125 RepID=A0AAV4V3L2_9ARAC|nr:hypothetical protein CDAR_292161 [Caerostris darwini]